MTTVYERIQHYYKLPYSIRFSKTQIRRIANYCKYRYDVKIENPPITFTQSLEDGEIFTVRYYPGSFVEIIDKSIREAHRKAKEHISKEMERKQVNEALKALKTIKEKKPRKKIVVKKPAFSAKPKNIL